MSWRRFQLLIRGLSRNSATVTKLTANQHIGSKAERVKEVVGKKQAEAAFDAIFPPPPPRPGTAH
jgi:hypothetical protein